MARYTESVCRLCRREGAKLYLKGTRCYTKKCAFERRPSPPGQHGVRRRKVGDYGLQLREKQKVRRVYGVLTNIPSFQLKSGDRVEVREGRKAREPFKLAKETLKSHQAPEWLSLDAAKLAGTVADLPRRDQMPLDLNEQLVVEFYS